MGVTRGVVLAVASPEVDEARRALQEELANPVYIKTWWRMFWLWVGDLFTVRVGDANLGPVLAPVLTIIGIAVLTIIVVLVIRTRRARRPTTSNRSEPVFGGLVRMSAEDYRLRAEEHRRAGRFADAVIDGFRAIAAAAIASHVVTETPDLTAREVGVALAAMHSPLADRVQHAARLFDLVLYGGRTAGPGDASDMVALDADLRDAGHSVSAAIPRSELPR